MAEDKRTNVNITATGGGSVSIGGHAKVGSIVEGGDAPLPAEASETLSVDPFDVFISYAHSDRAVVDQLARWLEGQGLSIWYDRELLAGDQFIRHINARLEAARAVIVVWSQASITSEWVLNEAEIARARGALIGLRLDASMPPAPFRLMHAPSVLDAAAQLAPNGLDEVMRRLQALPKG
ncbi:MAG: toll/interleukin-1 receptor domain-containing protein [Pseudomonadota bacterium]